MARIYTDEDLNKTKNLRRMMLEDYYWANRESMERAKTRQRILRDNCADNYVAKRIRKNSGLDQSMFPGKLLDVKRKSILVKRLNRAIKKNDTEQIIHISNLLKGVINDTVTKN